MPGEGASYLLYSTPPISGMRLRCCNQLVYVLETEVTDGVEIVGTVHLLRQAVGEDDIRRFHVISREAIVLSRCA